MATNPMQRKTRISFLMGVLITLIIAGGIIAFLFIQMKGLQEKLEEQKASRTEVVILNKDVKSGEKITEDYFEEVKVDTLAVPSNNISSVDLGEKNTAKIALKKGTILTEGMLNIDEDPINKDVRTVEYNMINMPSKIESGEYVDIRIQFPSGINYVVVSKKQVDILNVNGIDDVNTANFEMSEDEILAMSSAIIEAYQVRGTKIEMVKYVEPGMQTAAIPTYPVNAEVASLINANGNILDEAKRALKDRYNLEQRNNNIIPNLEAYTSEERQLNFEQKMEEEITNSKEVRNKYLESLGV